MNESGTVVFVVDDDASARASVANLLESVGLQVRTFASASEFSDITPPESASCLILDVRLPGVSGLDLQRQMAESGVRIPIIFVTGHGDIPMTVEAMKAGAVEFLTKPYREQALLDAVHLALERNRRDRESRASVEALRLRYASLTGREQKVMALVVAGLLNKQAADELGTSEATVKIQRQKVMQKMGAASLADLVRMADRLKAAN